MRAQAAAPPSAPTPQPGTLQLPPGAIILAQPHTPAPPAPGEDEFCSAPSDTRENATWKYNKGLTEAQRNELKDFMPLMLRQMDKEWLHHIPELATSQFSKGRTALVRFEINPGGDVSGVTLMMSAGRKSYDQHAIDTIKKSAPFPLPGDIQEPVHVCVRFEYNVTHAKPLPPDPLEPYALPPPKAPTPRQASGPANH